MATALKLVDLAERREAWLKERRAGIGGSDAPAVLGVSSFKTPLELFTEKLGLTDDAVQNERMEWGLRLEGAVIDAYGEKTGRDVKRGEQFTLTRSKRHDFMFATLDATINDPAKGPGTLQVKCSEYGWDGEVPPEYLVQIQHEMEVADLNWGSLAVLVRGNHFEHIDVDRHPRIVAHIVEREAEFMERLRKLEPPAAGPGDAEALARLYAKTTGEVIALPPEAGAWIDEKVALEAEIKERSERLDHLKNCCRQILGEAVYGLLPDGRRISWKPVDREDSKCPNCATVITPGTTYRRLTFHKK